MIKSDGTNARQLTPDSLQAGAGDWSPGGDRIVFANNDCDTCGASDIYVMNAGGQNIRPLTSNFGNNLDPKWSPDGTMITFTHSDSLTDFSQQQIYTMNADATGLFTLRTTPRTTSIRIGALARRTEPLKRNPGVADRCRPRN